MIHDETATAATAEGEYSVAYAAHYEEGDLCAALRLYESIIRRHAGTREAEYARVQVGNIVVRIVPTDVLRAAQIQLALGCLQPGGELLTTNDERGIATESESERGT